MAKIRRFFNLSRVFLKNFSSGRLQRGTGTGAEAGFSEDKKKDPRKGLLVYLILVTCVGFNAEILEMSL